MKLNELFKDYEAGMSQFQDDYFVTAKNGGTDYGQYKQSLRELYTRFRSLRELFYSHEILKIEINEIYEKLKEGYWGDKWEEAKQEIELKRKLLAFEESVRSINETEREFNRFYKQAVYLKKLLEERHGELNEKTKENLEKEMWLFKIKEFAVLDFITVGKLGKTTYDIIATIPPEMKMKVLRELQDPKSLVEWYNNHQRVLIPENLDHIALPDKGDMMKLEYTPKNIEMVEYGKD